MVTRGPGHQRPDRDDERESEEGGAQQVLKEVDAGSADHQEGDRQRDRLALGAAGTWRNGRGSAHVPDPPMPRPR